MHCNLRHGVQVQPSRATDLSARLTLTREAANIQAFLPLQGTTRAPSITTMARMLSDSPSAAAQASSAPAPVLITAAAAAGGVLPQQPAFAGSDDASFDGDMVMILAAMLCILVCAICLNTIVTCFRRLHSGRTVAAAHAAAAMMASVPATDAGLMKKRELLRKIPVVLYEAAGHNNKVSGATEECAICLGEFEVGDKVRVLPRCYHGFHVQCIDMWLPTHPSCPTCRNSLLHDDATPTVAGEQEQGT